MQVIYDQFVTKCSGLNTKIANFITLKAEKIFMQELYLSKTTKLTVEKLQKKDSKNSNMFIFTHFWLVL